jgi:hypothetical protein
MGGLGSGRRRGAKSTTNDFCKLDVRRLQRDGMLEGRLQFNWRWTRDGERVSDIDLRPESDRLNLIYRVRSAADEWELLNYPVFLERTSCNYGGHRVWFRCPARGCGRRVAILYGGYVFACRSCHQLNYQVQHEQPRDRTYSRAQKLHVRLGGTGNLTHDLPPKPTGMHRKTYQTLFSSLCEVEERMYAADLVRICRLVGFDVSEH